MGKAVLLFILNHTNLISSSIFLLLTHLSSRIFVQDAIYERFVESFSALTNALVVGDPLDSKTNMGALVSQQHIDKVMSYVELARSEGGNIVAGGSRVHDVKGGERGFFMRPTVITG